MSIVEKLTTAAENVPKVYNAGKQTEKERFWAGFWGENKGYYRSAFGGCGWNAESFNPIYPSTPITPIGSGGCREMFKYFNRNLSFNNDPIDLSEFCNHADFSQCTMAISCFENARATNITADFSNCANLTSAFNCGDGGYIDNINIKVTENCTNYLSTFASTSSLRSIQFTEDSVIAANIDFKSCNNLTLESLKSIINALKDYSTTDPYTKTLSLSSKSWSLLDADGNTAPDGGNWYDYVYLIKCWNV